MVTNRKGQNNLIIGAIIVILVLGGLYIFRVELMGVLHQLPVNFGIKSPSNFGNGNQIAEGGVGKIKYSLVEDKLYRWDGVNWNGDRSNVVVNENTYEGIALLGALEGYWYDSRYPEFKLQADKEYTMHVDSYSYKKVMLDNVEKAGVLSVSNSELGSRTINPEDNMIYVYQEGGMFTEAGYERLQASQLALPANQNLLNAAKNWKMERLKQNLKLLTVEGKEKHFCPEVTFYSSSYALVFDLSKEVEADKVCG